MLLEHNLTSACQSPRPISSPRTTGSLRSAVRAGEIQHGELHHVATASCGASDSRPLARPSRPEMARTRRQGHVPVLHPHLPPGRQARPWVHDRGPRRQPLPRLHRRHRRHQRRPLQPPGHEGHPPPGRPPGPHVRNRFLLHAPGPPRRDPRSPRAGPDPKRVFFTNSGAEAVEAALKLSRYHTGRPKVMSFLQILPRPNLRRHGLERLEANPPPRLRPHGPRDPARRLRRPRQRPHPPQNHLAPR